MAEETIDTGKRGPLKPAEVCSLLGIQPYVLKFWEAEIPLLGDRVGSRRRYGPTELEIARAIRECLVERRMTLREAREVLRERFPGETARVDAEAAPAAGAEPGSGQERRPGVARVRKLEKRLEEAEEKLARAREEITALEERARRAEEAARRLGEERDRERDAAREREESLVERVASLEEILSAERAAREKALDQAARVPELLGRIAALEAQLARAREERDRLAGELADARRRGDALREETMSFREQLLEGLSAAREELGGLHRELDALLVGLDAGGAGGTEAVGGEDGDAVTGAGTPGEERVTDPGNLFDDR